MTRERLKTCVRLLIAVFFIGVGLLHFINPKPFLHIMPPYLPWHLVLVYVSGFFEILGGVGLLISKVRPMAGWGLVGLLIAVYPANIHMLLNEVYLPDMPRSKALLWARMPLQFVMGWLVIWISNIGPYRDSKAKTVSADEA